MLRLWIPAALASALAALSLWPSVSVSPGLADAFRTAAAVLCLGVVLVAFRAWGEDRTLRLRFVPVRAHWVQTGVHACLYLAWGLHWPEVARHAPHIVAQILFYYAFELLFAWWRGSEARTGFGPIPIVGSVNLFLWFRDESFVLQFALLAVGVLAKELVHWERDGRRAHVFNPSSFPLFGVCAILWATGGDRITWAGEIAVTQGFVPHAWLGIFALGLAVQTTFATTLVTLCAVVTLYGLNLLYTQATGVYVWVDVGIPAAVFLGSAFLVTDPATSPRTERGRAAFGVLYGASVFLLYLWLREAGGPVYYDKLLCVPALNLCVRRLDRLGGPRAGGRTNLLHVGAFAAVFAALLGSGFLGTHHPGNDVAFWERACREHRWYACRSWGEMLDQACHEGEWGRCEQYAVLLDAGTEIERDRADAGYHLALACQEGVSSACDRIPAFLATGGDRAILARCEADDGLACLVLGNLWTGWESPAAPSAAAEREVRARAFVERGCDLGLPDACAWLGR